jgi:predicted metal-dependent hydrolase
MDDIINNEVIIKVIIMQVILNVPDEISQEIISKMLMQFENQLQTTKQLVTKKEKPVPKFGSAKGLIKMSADFDEPLDDFADYM